MNLTQDMIQSIKDRIESSMSERRRIHTYGVEEEIVRLSKYFDCRQKENELRIAALLHDITKEYEYKTQIEFCEKFAIPLSEDEMRSEKLLHAKTAAVIAKKEYGVTSEFYDAIFYHTTGREAMSLTEKLLYLADYIEKNRKDEECIALRTRFYEKIDVVEDKNDFLNFMLLESFDTTLRFLMQKRQFIHKDTINARNYYLKQVKKIY